MLCEKCVYYDVCRDEYKGRLMCASFEYNQDLLKLKHGEWLDNHNGTFVCSVCRGKSPRKRWCGDCGAKMDGGKAE